MHKDNRKGFTLVEVIVVLVILAILAAILIPSMTKWIDRAKAKTCFANRAQIYRLYLAVAADEYLSGTEVTVQKVLDGAYAVCADDVQKLVCPSGGTYTYDAGAPAIVCSAHGDMALPDDPGGSDGPGGDTKPATLPGTSVPLVDSYWPTADKIADYAGTIVEPGGVFERNGSYYVVVARIQLYGTAASQANPDNFLTQGSVIRLTGTVIPTTTAASLSSVKKGDVYTDANGNTFVARQDGYANLPPGNSPGVWHKIG